MGIRGGVNLYAMVNNNPVNYWDYLGLFEHRTMNFVIGSQNGFSDIQKAKLNNQYRKSMQEIVDKCLKKMELDDCYDCKVKFDIRSKAVVIPEKELPDKEYPVDGKDRLLAKENAKKLLSAPGQPDDSIYALFIDQRHMPQNFGAYSYDKDANGSNIIVNDNELMPYIDAPWKVSEKERLILPHELGHTGGYHPSSADWYKDDKNGRDHSKKPKHIMFPNDALGTDVDDTYCFAILRFCKNNDKEK